MRPQGTAEELERRRRRAAGLFKQGFGVCEVARRTGASAGTVSGWRKRYEVGGVKALAAKPHLGPTPKLDYEQVQILLTLLARGATAHGYANDLWTLGRAAAVARKAFGVEYEPSGVWRLLRRHGWSSQKPETQARERDETAIRRFRRVVWPAVKKSRGRRASRSP